MPNRTTVAADTSLPLGNASGQAVGRIVLHVTAYTSGSATPTARGTGSGAAGVNIPYTNRAAPSSLVAAGTVINAVGIYEFDATGVDIILALSSLVATLYWTALEG